MGAEDTGHHGADTGQYCPVPRVRPAFCKHSLDTQYLGMSPGRQTTQEYSDQGRAGETRDKMLAAVRIVWTVFVFSYCLMICPQEQVVLQGHH